jgi:SWI/SNF-related matrix-associated actin-dependent regulator of chromatin subfamily B protein 1
MSRTAIAHSIREQIYWHVKSLISSGYNFDPNNSYIDDADLQEAFLPSAWEPPFRDENTQDLFMPVITQLTEAEVEKLEQHRERDARYD